MNQAKIPRTVADAARMTRIQRLSCTSGHWYRRRVSRYITSVAMAQARMSQVGGQDEVRDRRRYPVADKVSDRSYRIENLVKDCIQRRDVVERRNDLAGQGVF